MKNIILFFFGLFCLSAPSGCSIYASGNGQIIEREINVVDFTKLRIHYRFQVTVQQGTAFSVKVRADENLWPFIEASKLDDKTLYIGDKRSHLSGFVEGTLEATVTMPSFEGAKVTGSSKLTLSNFPRSESLELDIAGTSVVTAQSLSANSGIIKLSGSSKLDAQLTLSSSTWEVSGSSEATGNIEGTTASFKSNGGSKTNLSGLLDSATFDISGAGQAAMENLTVQSASLDISGASNVSLRVADTGTINVKISGGSILRHFGSGKVNTLDQSGDSKIISNP